MLPAVTACAPTVTVAFAIGVLGVTAPCSTTVTVTSATFASERSTVDGVITPCSSTVTGTVTTRPSFSTVTVPSVGAGTSGTVAWPSLPVVASCFFPSSSTMVTVAPSTLFPPSVTVTVTGAVFLSSILSGLTAVPASFTFSSTVSFKYPVATAFTPA